MQHSRAPVPYLAEARALYDLVRDGHERLRYHIARGHAVRDATSGQVELSSYVEAGRWLPARDRQPDGALTDRLLNPYVLARHLAGKYDVAWEAPSWSSLVVFDIDCHVAPARSAAGQRAARREAVLARDQVLAGLWRAFGFGPDKQPVILSTPSGGYHVYLPLLGPGAPGTEGLWPNGCVRRHLEAHLAAHGLGLQPGRLELFPTGVRLRAPCGRGMLLLAPERPADADDLRLGVVAGTYRGPLARGLEAFLEEQADGRLEARRLQPQFEARRQVAGQVAAFLAAVARARRPLHAWLGCPRPLWHATWGPFGHDAGGHNDPDAAGTSARAQHKEDVQGGGGPCPPEPGPVARDPRGWLLRGRAFLRRIVDLTRNGLTEPGQRHDAALKLTFYFGAVLGLPREEVLARLEEWLGAFIHCSATYRRSERQFVRNTLREAAHYYDHHVAACVPRGPRRRVDIAERPLAAADRAAVRAAVAPELWGAVEAVLAHLGGFADAAGVVGAPVDLSHRTLLLVCGDRRIRAPDGRRRRAYVVALEELARLGVLTLHTNYATGRHARRFSVWYCFGSGALPATDPATGYRVLARRQVTEGTLLVLAPGDGSQAVRLAHGPDGGGAMTGDAAADGAGTEPRLPGCAAGIVEDGVVGPAGPAAARDEPDETAGPAGGSTAAAPPAMAPEPAPEPAGRGWWRRMFARRLFTVAELLHADESTVIPGPWTWRRPAPARARPRPQSPVPPPRSRPGHDEDRDRALPLPTEVSPPALRPRAGPRPALADDALQHAIDQAWAAFERSRRGKP